MNAGEQALYALLIGLPATVLGLLAYRRSRKVDAVTEQAGVASESRAGTGQIIEGLNQLIDNLQDDNREFREELRRVIQRCDGVANERDALRREVNRLYRKYGENGEILDEKS